MTIIRGMTDEQRHDWLQNVPVICFIDRLHTTGEVLASKWGEIRASEDLANGWKFLANVSRVRPEIKCFGGSDCIWIWGYGIKNVIEVSVSLFQQLHFIYYGKFRGGIAQGDVEIGSQWLEELHALKKKHSLSNFHPPHLLVGEGSTLAVEAESRGSASQIFLHKKLSDILSVTPHPELKNWIGHPIDAVGQSIRWADPIISEGLLKELGVLGDQMYGPFDPGLVRNFFSRLRQSLDPEFNSEVQHPAA